MNSNLELDDDAEVLKSTNDTQRPSELRKRAKHFEQSRDEWKKRNAEKRAEKQVLMTRNSRLEQRLQKREEDVLGLKKKLDDAEKQIEILEHENNIKNEQIEDLKKNSFVRTTRC